MDNRGNGLILEAAVAAAAPGAWLDNYTNHKWMMIAPVQVLLYTAWAYRVMFGRIPPAEVATNHDFY